MGEEKYDARMQGNVVFEGRGKIRNEKTDGGISMMRELKGRGIACIYRFHLATCPSVLPWPFFPPDTTVPR